MADLTPSQVKDMADAMQKVNKLFVDSAKQAQLIFLASKNTANQDKAELKLRQEVMKNYVTELASLRKIAEVSKTLAATELKRLQGLMNMDVALEKQEATLQNINLMNEKNRRIQDQEIEIMRKKGMMAKAYFAQLALNAKRSFQTESGHTTGASAAQGGAKAGAGAVGIAQNPREMLNSLGPWGIIIGFIADVIDGVRMMGGELQKASAESGKFADSFDTTREESQNLFNSQISLMTKYGMTVKEAGQIFGELKNTGIAALGVIPKTGTALSGLALDVMSFAKATNQSTAEVSEQYASMVRSFGESVDHLGDTYDAIFSMSAKAAGDGVAKVSEMVKTVFSLGDAFKEIGVNLKDVTKITGAVAKAIKDLGRPGGIDQVQKIASGILGITRASEGWQVFMSKMSGNSGGFAQALFGQQQRGANFALPGAGEFDATKTINSFKGMLSKTTGGIADPATRQLMVEKMGQQVGMDTQTTQVFQKLMSGGMDEKMAKKDLEKIHKAAIDNNMSTKGMFDILKEVLVGMIAKPIIGIWKLISKWRGDAKSSEQADKLSEKLNKQPGEAAGSEVGKIGSKAIGADVTRSGLMMVHAGNTIVPAAKSTAYKEGVKSGSGGVSVTFNMQIDEKTLHKKFMQMEQQTLELLHKQQKSNF